MFSLDIDLDGDSHEERVVVGVFETTSRELGRFLLVLGRNRDDASWTKRALFSLKDSYPFSAIQVRNGKVHWVGCFECDDDCIIERNRSAFRLVC